MLLVIAHGAVALAVTASPSRFTQFSANASLAGLDRRARGRTRRRAGRSIGTSAAWRIVEEGDIWEKGCISVTLIEDGELNAVRATISRTGAEIAAGAGLGVRALVRVHGRSPLAPTALRARVFVVGDDEWYGGGLDLTPSYVEEDDCRHFHGALAALCAAHGERGPTPR